MAGKREGKEGTREERKREVEGEKVTGKEEMGRERMVARARMNIKHAVVAPPRGVQSKVRRVWTTTNVITYSLYPFKNYYIRPGRRSLWDRGDMCRGTSMAMSPQYFRSDFIQ